MIPTQVIPAAAPGAPSLNATARRSVPLYAILAVIAFSAFWTLLGSMVVPGARLHDFLSFYTGASLARDGVFRGMYMPEVQLQHQREYAQLPDLVPYIRPPFYALFLAPLAWIPFGPAFWTWLGVQAVALAGTWAWAFRRWGSDALIFGSMYLPAALGIAHGQDCVLIFLIVLATFALAEREQHFLSGVTLGVGLLKFHLFLLWPVMLLIQRRWRMLAGASAAVTAEVLISLALAGRSGLTKYAALLRMNDLRNALTYSIARTDDQRTRHRFQLRYGRRPQYRRYRSVDRSSRDSDRRGVLACASVARYCGRQRRIAAGRAARVRV